MARALMGHVGTAQDQLLAFEVVRLRRRVAELQAEIAELRAAHGHSDGVDIDLELHRITETSTPALA